MPYSINQCVHQFNSIQSVPVSFGLWDTALKFLSPGPRSDVTDHLEVPVKRDSTVLWRTPGLHLLFIAVRLSSLIIQQQLIENCN